MDASEGKVVKTQTQTIGVDAFEGKVVKTQTIGVDAFEGKVVKTHTYRPLEWTHLKTKR